MFNVYRELAEKHIYIARKYISDGCWKNFVMIRAFSAIEEMAFEGGRLFAEIIEARCQRLFSSGFLTLGLILIAFIF